MPETFQEYVAFMARSDRGFFYFFALVAGTALLWRLTGVDALISLDSVSFRLPAPSWHRLKKIRALWAFSGLSAALLVGFLLRLIRIDDVLWFDESFTAGLAQLPLDRMLRVVLADVHPPTNYLITWVTVRIFGSEEWALRLPALVAGTALIWLTYRLARALRYSHRVGVVAAWLIVFMPAAIKYANEARQYALMTCLVFGLVIALLEGRKRWFVLLGVLVAWSHNLGFFYLGLLGLTAIVYRRSWLRPTITSWLLAALWLPGVLHQTQEVANGFWITFIPEGAVVPLFSMTFTGALPAGLTFVSLPFWFAAVAVAISWARRWLLSRRGLVWLVLVAGVPAAVAVVSLVWKPVYLHRALLPSVLGLMPLLAWFLVENRRGRRLYRVAVTIALGVAFLGTMHPDKGNTLEGPDMQQICKGADAVYNTALATQFLSIYYLPDLPSYLSPVAGDVGEELPPHALKTAGFEVLSTPLLAGTDVCLIVADTPFSAGTEFIKPFIEPGNHIHIRRDYHAFYGIDFYRLFVS